MFIIRAPRDRLFGLSRDTQWSSNKSLHKLIQTPKAVKGIL